MRHRRFIRLFLVALIPFLGCARAPKTFDAISVSPPVAVPTTTTRPPARVQLAARTSVATLARRAQVRHWNETVLVNAMVANAEAARLGSAQTASNEPAAPAAPTPPASADPSRAPCDGDLPPCWRIIGIESGGRWDAHNYGGCEGHDCWGPYQFSGSWAGKLGLPLDLWTTTHDQWVAAARALWNGGAGCGNWSACP